MKRKRYFLVCSIAIFVSMILVVAGVAMAGGKKDKAPEFKVDANWPKPLPNCAALFWILCAVPIPIVKRRSGCSNGWMQSMTS